MSKIADFLNAIDWVSKDGPMTLAYLERLSAEYGVPLEPVRNGQETPTALSEESLQPDMD